MKLLLSYLTTSPSLEPEEEKLALSLGLLCSRESANEKGAVVFWQEQEFLFSPLQEFDVLQQIDFFLRQHNLTKQMLTALALVHGPGRFTPLRSCVTVFKTLAYALALPLLAASVFEACAQQLQSPQVPILLLHSSRSNMLFLTLCYQGKIWGPILEFSFVQLQAGFTALRKNPQLQISWWWKENPLPVQVETHTVKEQLPKVVFCDAASKRFLAAYPTALLPQQQLTFSFELQKFAGYVKKALLEKKHLSTAAKLTLSPYYGRSFH